MEGRDYGTERSRSSKDEAGANNPAVGENSPVFWLAGQQKAGSGPKQIEILQEMFSYVPKEEATGKMTFDAHFAMRKQLQAAGMMMSDLVFNDRVLFTLPARFIPFTVIIWRGMKKSGEQSSDHLSEALKLYDTEERLKREHDMMVYRNRKIKCFDCKERGHKAASCESKKKGK